MHKPLGSPCIYKVNISRSGHVYSSPRPSCISLS